MQKASLVYFASQNISGAPEYGGKFIVGRHHMEWSKLVAEHRHILILAPRDHGKSHMMNIAYPVWRGIFGRSGELGYIFSAKQERANEQLELVVQEIVTNPRLRYLAPLNWERTWSKQEIKLTTGVTIRARGFGVKVRGAHPQWIICDDMLSDSHIYSEADRRKAEDIFFGAISNMLTPGGQLLVVGTPFHELDLYASIKEKGVYAIWSKPAILDEARKIVLWPERYSYEYLQFKKREVGSIRFTREFMVNPISDDMSIFPRYLFTGEPVIQRSVRLGMPAAYWEELGVQRFMGVDIAMSAETGADFLVLYVLGVDAMGNRWTCDIHREKGMGFQAQLDLINRVGKLNDCALIFIEANQMQRIWGNELIRTTDLPIKPFITTAQGKNSLERGVPSLRVLLENRKWRIPQGDARSVELTEQWIHEMTSFAWIDGKLKGVGAHDDIVMACWMADQAVRLGAFTFSFDADGAMDQAELEQYLTGEDENNVVEGEPTVNVVDAFDQGGAGSYDGTDPTADRLWTAAPFYKG